MGLVSGINGHLIEGTGNSAVTYKAREWTLKLSAARIDVSNFTSSGWSQFLPGIKTGELSARIFYDTDDQLTLGTVMNMNLGLGSSFFITFSATLMDMSLSTAVDKAAEANVTLYTNGSFTTTFATS